MSRVALALGCEEALPVCGLSFSLSTCFLFLFWPQEEPGVSRRSSGSDVTLRTGDTAQTHTVTQRASFCASPLSLWDSIYRKYPEQVKTQRQTADEGLLGAGGAVGSECFQQSLVLGSDTVRTGLGEGCSVSGMCYVLVRRVM